MIAVIFEVWPKPERYQEYLDLAASLKSELEKIDGFISVERFQSIHDKGKILSLSLWRDEHAVRAWRAHPDHREVQLKGRFEIFQDYRLCVAQVIRDYGMFDREQAPQKLAAVSRSE